MIFLELSVEWIAETNEVVTFSSSVVRGSHVDWNIQFGDGDSDSVCHYYSDPSGTPGCVETTILNRQQDFTHPYLLPGNIQ